MKKSPKPSPTSEISSSLNLVELLQQSQSTTPKTTTSATPPTAIALREKRGPKGKLVTSQKNKAALEAFEDSVGGRERLVETLGLADLSEREKAFLGLLCDPARRKDNLATIARDAGLLPSQVIGLFRSASFSAAYIKLSAALPDVMDDMASKAVDAEIMCPECFGEDLGPDMRCVRCLGRGTIMRYSDIDRQKIMLEAVGVIKRQQGVQVNQNVQVNNMSQPGNFFSSFVKSSDKGAYDIEAEVLDPANPSKT
jgi:hypothetical protein